MGTQWLRFWRKKEPPKVTTNEQLSQQLSEMVDGMRDILQESKTLTTDVRSWYAEYRQIAAITQEKIVALTLRVEALEPPQYQQQYDG